MSLLALPRIKRPTAKHLPKVSWKWILVISTTTHCGSAWKLTFWDLSPLARLQMVFEQECQIKCQMSNKNMGLLIITIRVHAGFKALGETACWTPVPFGFVHIAVASSSYNENQRMIAFNFSLSISSYKCKCKKYSSVYCAWKSRNSHHNRRPRNDGRKTCLHRLCKQRAPVKYDLSIFYYFAWRLEAVHCLFVSHPCLLVSNI